MRVDDYDLECLEQLENKEINTYVNEEKGTIACVIKVNGLLGYNKFVGKAKCLPEDKFDVELGKKLASARAWQKYDEAKLRQMWTIRDEIQKEIDKIDERIEKQEARLDKTIDKRIKIELELEN